MTDVVLTKQKIEPEKTERLREWADEIRDHENDAIATLENVGMHQEDTFVERSGDEDFLVYFMKAEDVGGVFEAFEASDHDIDREHAEVMEDVPESPGRVGNCGLLYWLSNPERTESGTNSTCE